MKKENKLIISVILLSIFGLLMVFSASHIWSEYKFNNSYKYVINQGIFCIIGIILMLIIKNIDINKVKNKANILISVCFLLLLLVVIPGIGQMRNGSRSWFNLGPFGFQPSEITKIALIIFTSRYLSKNDKEKRNTKSFLFPILGIIILFFMLIMLEPDFGTGVVIVMSLIGIIFITGTRVTILVKAGILGIIGVIILILIAPYRMKRITSFINPWSDPLGSGFQIIQSLYAIGPGGILGHGYLKGRQSHFYLPEPQTDFIFSIICEEFGLLGALLVISLFTYIFYKAIKISINADSLFKKYLSFGLSFMLIFQTLLNLMVVVGIIPVTGVTLPFLSYGGSSLLVSYISIGLILACSK